MRQPRLCKLLFLFVLLVSLAQPANGFLAFFQEMEELGIFRFSHFFTDFYNLFFGKRKLQCALKIQTLLANTGPLLQGGYRDDSIMILPEAGPYVGSNSILEYVKFADAGYSPYVKVGPIGKGQKQVVIGYDGMGQCEYHWQRMNGYTMDETYVGEESHFVLPVFTKVYLDFKENYVKRAYVFYSNPFLKFYFGDQLNTRPVAEYICNEALGSDACRAMTGEPPADCVDRLMNDIPLTDANDYVDGDSRSCRALHATFVAKNPAHCQHVSLEPSDVDGKGGVKCSASYQLPHDRYFTEADMEEFAQFQTEYGVDPSQGYRTLSNIDEDLI